MTTQANIPAKWYVPFAQGDASRVEIPVTAADPTRASQTLGFPPLTMQPPESGGVPPQGEDFNGAMNQVARVAWWILNGGGWPYDAAFATNSNINGYPNGAKLQSADFRGDWINTTDGNQNNPDTVGTNWVPGFQYGVTALAGLTGGMVTPTPAQAAKGTITLAGTLTSALTIILPAWLKNWSITNNTTGAFVTIVKTAAGSGVTIPQNGTPTRVSGDGTNIVQTPENIALATSPSHAIPVSQVGHGQCRIGTASATSLVLSPFNGNILRINGVPQTIPAGGVAISNGGLVASTAYYVYAFMNAGAMTLELSTTGHATSATDGVEIKSGDATRTLVGLISTNASAQFENTNARRFVLNWFNRQPLSAMGTLSANRSTTSSTFVEIGLTGERANFLLWANQVVKVSVSASSFQNTAGSFSTMASIDGSTAGPFITISPPSGQASASSPFGVWPNALGEGVHYAAILGNATPGFTATWNGAAANQANVIVETLG